MAWLLDTNQWIMLLKGRCKPVADKITQLNPDEIWLCSIVKQELLHGAHKYDDVEARRAKLKPVFDRHPSASFDDEAAAEAARIRHDLETSGNKIGPHDTQIAGLALIREWTLVTANTKEFSRVSGLKLEDWTKEG